MEDAPTGRERLRPFAVAYVRGFQRALFFEAEVFQELEHRSPSGYRNELCLVRDRMGTAALTVVCRLQLSLSPTTPPVPSFTLSCLDSD